MKPFSYKKYITVFLITLVIFVTAFGVSNYLNNKKVADIKQNEDQISVSILSLETQFELLQESTCATIDKSSLGDELTSLADKLSFAESHNEISASEVEGLKKYYSLLEIKDYLLMKKVSRQCNLHPIVIVYFYSSTNCEDCQKQGYILTYLRENYPGIRVYTFDYNLDLPAIKTLIDIHETKKILPALIINDKVYNGFQDLDTMKEIIAPFLPKETATSTATTSPKKK